MKTSTTSIWNCLSTKITYMEIWKAWLPRHISYSTSSVPFGNSEMTSSPTSHLPNNSEPQSPPLFSPPTGSDARTRLHTCSHAHCLVNWFLAPTITHLFQGWWCIHCWQEARSPPWCTSAGRTCTCSRAPSHAGSTWWCRGYWCLQSAAAPLQCRWLDVKMAAKWWLVKLRVLIFCT